LAIDLVSGEIYTSDQRLIYKFKPSFEYFKPKLQPQEPQEGLCPNSLVLTADKILVIVDTSNSFIQVGHVRISEPGSENGQLVSPWGVALDNEHNIVVADTGNDRIQTFSQSGVYLKQFGKKTGQPISAPMAIAVDPQGRYIVGSGIGIQIFSSEGLFIQLIGNREMYRTRGLAVDRKGSIVTTDHDHAIRIYSKDGELLTTIKRKGPLPHYTPVSESITIDLQGNIICTSQQFHVVGDPRDFTPEILIYDVEPAC